MDRIQHKLAMEFFRSEIKSLSERLSHTKHALRHNQRIISLGLSEPTIAYKPTKNLYCYCPEHIIRSDKFSITCLYIAYATLRGKTHIPKEKVLPHHVKELEAITARMEEFITEIETIEPIELLISGRE